MARREELGRGEPIASGEMARGQVAGGDVASGEVAGAEVISDDATARVLEVARGEKAAASASVASGYYLYGVTRAQGWRPRGRGRHGQRCSRVRFRDLEAVVAPVPFGLPELDAGELEAHQRVVGDLACRCTILPAPPGVVFSGRRALVGFLDDQYLVLAEGLTLLEGHWEFRLHVRRAESSTEVGAGEWARLYSTLRGRTRAALSFPHRDGLAFTAAFLVERSRWIDFVEQAEGLGASHPELVLDLTGPWPPYDFVKLVA